jgi:hypothetical protein
VEIAMVKEKSMKNNASTEVAPGITKAQADMAVKLAKDVLAQLDKRLYKVKTGDYFNPYMYANYRALPDEADLKKNLPLVQKKCEVCADGALFLSLVRKENNVTVEEGWNRKRLEDKIGEQTNLIEFAFEQSSMYYPEFAKYPPRTRLRKIMHRIIKNNGIFDPGRSELALGLRAL